MISSSTSKHCKKKESQTVKRYGSEVRGPTLPLRGSGQMAQTGAGRNGIRANPTILYWRVKIMVKTVWSCTSEQQLGTTNNVTLNKHSSVRKIRIRH